MDGLCLVHEPFAIQEKSRRKEKMVEKLKKILDVTFWKFIVVGVINTVVGTGVMFAAYNLLHLSYWISSASNYVVGSVVSYFLNKYFTFQNKEKSWKQLGKFVVNITICYLLAYGMAKPIVSWILQEQSKNIQDNVSMLVGMGAFVVFNYVGQRMIVFKRK